MQKILNHSLLLNVLFFIFVLLFSGAGIIGSGFAQDLWQQTNGPFGGNVPSMAINNTSGAIFAGGDAGVFRSDDNGDTWTSVSAGLPADPVLSIAVNSSGNIFAGSFQGSLHRSLDNGVTWELKNTGLPPDFDISSMIITATGSIVVGSFNGVYYSTDNGENWTQALLVTGGPIGEMTVLYISPAGDILGANYTGIYEADGNGDNWSLLNQPPGTVNAMAVNSAGDFFIGSWDGVQRLLSGQQTWNYVNTGLPQTIDIKKLAINSNSILFAGTYDGLYRSTDNGANWTNISTGLTSTDVNEILFNTTGTTFTTTRGGIFSSTDDGNNWSRKNNGMLNSTVKVMESAPNGNFYAGTASGLYSSNDAGVTWTEIPALLGNDVKYIIVNTTGNIFVGTQKSGVYRSLNDGVTWTQANTGLTGTEIRAMTINAADELFVAAFDNFLYTDSLYRSNDNGASWTAINGTLSEPLALAVDGDGDLFASTWSGIFRSANNGVNWDVANGNLTGANFLNIRPDGYMFAGTFNGLVMSNDKGVSWLNKNNGLTDSTHIQTFYISRKGHLFAGTQTGGLFRSANLGDNWVAASNGLTNLSVHALAMNNTGDFLLGTIGSGVFSSLYDNSIHSVSPPSIDFGPVRTATTKTDSVIVTNTGFAELNVGPFNLSGTNAPNFIVTSTPFVLTPGESRAVQINFTPGARLVHSASLDIVSAGDTSTVELSGTGIAPVLSLIMTTFDIGNVRVNTTQQIDSLYLITNSGDDSLTVSLAEFTGTDAASFSVTDNLGKLGLDEDGWFSFSFSPTRTGSFSALLNINTDGGNGQITITGAGSAPILQVTPLSIDFADVALGTSASDTLKVKNIGDAILSVNIISLSGTNAAYFSIAESPFTLDPGDSTELEVFFSPTINGTFSAQIIIQSDGGNSTVNLSGTWSQPVFSSSQDTIDFGELQIGAFRDKQLSITNSGTGNLIINEVFMAGQNPTEFIITESTTNLPPLPSLSTLDFMINFVPTSLGDKYSYLIFASNSPTTPDTVFLTGIGIQSHDIEITHDQATGGNPLTLTFNLHDSPTPTRQIMYYRNAGQFDFQSTPLSGADSIYTGVIPAQYVNLRGVEYYILMTVDGIDYTYPPTNPQYNPLTAQVFYNQYEAPLTLTPMKYKMVSFPCEVLDATVESVFFDDYGPYDNKHWRLSYYYETETSYFIEYPFPDDFDPTAGVSFWLITRTGNPFDVEDVYSMPSSDSVYYSLQPGWNQVGCPFAFPVSIFDMNGSDSLDFPVHYDNTTNDYSYDITVLQPWEGYYVYNRDQIPVTIAIPPVEAHGTLPKSNSPVSIQNDRDYILQLSARIPDSEYQDSQNYLGLLSDAREDLDSRDFFEAPPIGDYIQLSIIEDEKRFAGNFKPVSTDGQKWDLTLNSTFKVNKTVRISLIEKGALGDSLNLYILDRDNNAIIPVKDGSFDLNIKHEGVTRHLSVILGTNSFAQNNSDGVPLVPYAFGLDQNYPNPFNPETTIRYQLPAQDHVKLEIFNTLGHKIRTLVNGVQNTGEHIVVWDGLNDAGYQVAGGLYFYRLSSNDVTSIKKMILIR